MKLSKKISKSRSVEILLSVVLAFYMRLVYYTSRRRFLIDAGAKPYIKGVGNGIFAFWHGRMLLLPCICPPNHIMRVLISLHSDGKLISRTILRFGQKTISGSTSRGGKKAVSDILRALAAGDNISITPDGPRGPSQVAAPGIAAIARFSNKPVLPVAFSSTRAKRLQSWDHFMLALPFGRIVFLIGEPIFVSEDEDEEQARIKIERAMNKLVEKADGLTHA